MTSFAAVIGVQNSPAAFATGTPMIMPGFYNFAGESGTAMTIDFTTLNFTSGNAGVIFSMPPSPHLPSGLSFNPATGQIHGTPRESFPFTTFNVIAQDASVSSESATAVVNLSVSPGSRSIGSSHFSLKGVVGQSISSPAPIPTNFYYTPFYSLVGIHGPIPDGLNFDTTTGVISGTPTQTMTPTEFTLNAQSSGAESASRQVTISVVNQAPHARYGAFIDPSTDPVKSVFSPDGSRLYEINASDPVINIFDTHSQQWLQSVLLSDTGYDIAITPDGRKVLVSIPLSDQIAILDTSTNAITQIALPNYPLDIAVSPDGSRAYITEQRADGVAVIDLEIGMIVHTIVSGSGPLGIVISNDGTHLVVSNMTSDTLSYIDATSGTVEATIVLPINSSPQEIAISPDGLTAYVVDKQAGHNKLLIVDLGTNQYSELQDGLPMTAISDVKVSPLGDVLYLSGENNGAGIFQYFDLPTLTPLGSDNYITNPGWMSISSDGLLVGVTAFDLGQVVSYSRILAPLAPTVTIDQSDSVSNDSEVKLQIVMDSTAGRRGTGLEYSVDGGATYNQALFAQWGNTYFVTAGGLTNGVSYSIRVRATNAAGPGTASAPVTAMPGIPGQAGLSSVTAGDGTLTLNYGIIGSVAGLNNSYEYSLNNGPWQSMTHTGLWSYQSQVTGLTNGTSYSVRVRARNDFGGGLPSSAIAATPNGPIAPVLNGGAISIPASLQIASHVKISIQDGLLLCSLGKYLYGSPGEGVVAPISEAKYSLKVNGLEVKSALDKKDHFGWDLSALPKTGLATCEALITYSGASLKDSSTMNDSNYAKFNLEKSAALSLVQLTALKQVNDLKLKVQKDLKSARLNWLQDRNALNSEYSDAKSALTSKLASKAISSQKYSEGRKKLMAEHAKKGAELYAKYRADSVALKASLVSQLSVQSIVDDLTNQANKKFYTNLLNDGYGYLLS